MSVFLVSALRTITLDQECRFPVEAENEGEAKKKIIRLLDNDLLGWDTVDTRVKAEATYTMEEM